MTPPLSTNVEPAKLEPLVAEVVERNPELSFYRAEIAAVKGERRTAEAGGQLGIRPCRRRPSFTLRRGDFGAVEVKFRIALHHFGNECLQFGGLNLGG